MTSRAIVAIFETDEQSLAARRRQVERLANEVHSHMQSKKAPRAVILLAGTRVAFAFPDTTNFHRLCALKSSMFIGVYDSEADAERLRNDFECALSEYYEGRGPAIKRG